MILVFLNIADVELFIYICIYIFIFCLSKTIAISLIAHLESSHKWIRSVKWCERELTCKHCMTDTCEVISANSFHITLCSRDRWTPFHSVRDAKELYIWQCIVGVLFISAPYTLLTPVSRFSSGLSNFVNVCDVSRDPWILM